MEDINLKEIKDILGNKASLFPDEKLIDDSVKMKFLIELWLDCFEREIFEGKTLEELLASNIL